LISNFSHTFHTKISIFTSFLTFASVNCLWRSPFPIFDYLKACLGVKTTQNPTPRVTHIISPPFFFCSPACLFVCPTNVIATAHRIPIRIRIRHSLWNPFGPPDDRLHSAKPLDLQPRCDHCTLRLRSSCCKLCVDCEKTSFPGVLNSPNWKRSCIV